MYSFNRGQTNASPCVHVDAIVDSSFVRAKEDSLQPRNRESKTDLQISTQHHCRHVAFW